MLIEQDEAPIQSDSYIEALLDGHARRPIRIPHPDRAPSSGIRHVIRVLEGGLPRYHPSFLFEERLAAELRAAADMPIHQQFAVDRRLLMGGAFASGVSIAGAAVFAWWKRRD
jgi:hypothetical protein